MISSIGYTVFGNDFCIPHSEIGVSLKDENAI